MLFRVPEPLVNIGQFLKQITASPMSGSRRSLGFPCGPPNRSNSPLSKQLLHFRVGTAII
jgi:hypothetical protein